MKHVLVTGASGFVGRALLPRLLSAGWRVTALGRAASEPSGGPAGVDYQRADLLEPGAARACVAAARASHLIHLAWVTEHGRYWHADENLRWLGASLELLQAFVECGGRSAVMAGTCAEYDWRHGWCSEALTPCRPRSLYGSCKDALRRAAERYCAEHGMPFAWGRIFYPYGVGEPAPRLIPSTLAAMRGGAPVRCSHGRQFRDFLHVDDVAEGFARLAETSAEGCFNISSGVPIALREIVASLAAIVGWQGAPEYGAIEVAEDDPPLLIGDPARLKALGWTPRIGLQEGLRRTAEGLAER